MKLDGLFYGFIKYRTFLDAAFGCTSTDKFGPSISWQFHLPTIGSTAILWKPANYWQVATTDLNL
jgi:hypothetical protein